MSGRMADRPLRRHRRVTLRVMVEYAGRSEPATTLGAGGMFIETEAPIAPGTDLLLSFTLPGSDVRHDVRGTVAWWHRPTDGTSQTPGMGICFQDRPAAMRLARDLETQTS